MLKRIQILEDGRVLAKEVMAQKGPWNLSRENMLQDRGALPKEEGDVVRGY